MCIVIDEKARNGERGSHGEGPGEETHYTEYSGGRLQLDLHKSGCSAKYFHWYLMIYKSRLRNSC